MSIEPRGLQCACGRGQRCHGVAGARRHLLAADLLIQIAARGVMIARNIALAINGRTDPAPTVIDPVIVDIGSCSQRDAGLELRPGAGGPKRSGRRIGKANRFGLAPGFVVDDFGEKAFFVDSAGQQAVIVVEVTRRAVIIRFERRQHLRGGRGGTIAADAIGTVDRRCRELVIIARRANQAARSIIVKLCHRPSGVDRLDYPPGFVIDRPGPAIRSRNNRPDRRCFGGGCDRAQCSQVRRRYGIGISHRCDDAVRAIVLVFGHRTVAVDRRGQPVLLVIGVVSADAHRIGGLAQAAERIISISGGAGGHSARAHRVTRQRAADIIDHCVGRIVRRSDRGGARGIGNGDRGGLTEQVGRRYNPAKAVVNECLGGERGFAAQGVGSRHAAGQQPPSHVKGVIHPRPVVGR